MANSPSANAYDSRCKKREKKTKARKTKQKQTYNSIHLKSSPSCWKINGQMLTRLPHELFKRKRCYCEKLYSSAGNLFVLSLFSSVSCRFVCLYEWVCVQKTCAWRRKAGKEVWKKRRMIATAVMTIRQNHIQREMLKSQSAVNGVKLICNRKRL